MPRALSLHWGGGTAAQDLPIPTATSRAREGLWSGAPGLHSVGAATTSRAAPGGRPAGALLPMCSQPRTLKRGRGCPAHCPLLVALLKLAPSSVPVGHPGRGQHPDDGHQPWLAPPSLRWPMVPEPGGIGQGVATEGPAVHRAPPSATVVSGPWRPCRRQRGEKGTSHSCSACRGGTRDRVLGLRTRYISL